MDHHQVTAGRTLAKISIHQALSKAASHAKKGEVGEAKNLYQSVLQAFPKNGRAQQGLASLTKSKQNDAMQDLPPQVANQLVALYNQGQLASLIEQAQALTQKYPEAFFVWNILGAAYLGLQKATDAEIAFTKVTELNSTYAAGFNNLGLSLKDQGKLNEAIAVYNKAISINPNYAEAYNSMGSALKEKGNLEEAIRFYQKALLIKPKYSEAHNNLGLVLQNQGKLSDAIKFYQKALLLKPNYESYYNIGNALQEQGKLDEAILCYRKSLSIKPDYAETHVNMSNVFREQGKLDDAVQSCKKALSIKPNHAEAQNNMGATLKDLGKLDEALEACKKAILIKPDYAVAYNNIGVTLKQQGKLDDAISAYQKALLINPNYAEAHNNLGSLLKEQGKLCGAIMSYKTALSIKPNYTQAYINMGNALREQGKLDGAIRFFHKALSIKSDSADAHISLGSALREQGKLDGAIRSFHKAISITPESADAHVILGNAFRQQGKLNEAILSYNRAISIKPDYADAYNNMGNALKDQGKIDEAIQSYKKALSIIPDYAEVYSNIANALREQGKLDEAISSYQKALIIKPDYASAHRDLSALIKYENSNPQIKAVDYLLNNSDLKDGDRCHLLYSFGKMSEDLDDYDSAFNGYSSGGAIRKKLLAYDFIKDQRLFAKIEENALSIKFSKFDTSMELKNITPIFIVGMPRSGTTLVEQILSSHSLVNGAGELSFFGRFGDQVNLGYSKASPDNFLKIRKFYLSELMEVSNGRLFVTDKMPHNFLRVGLILKSLPEAKIIHVKRDPAATCWSNFKHFFPANGLGYSYDLEDMVRYFKLYRNLMNFWEDLYQGQIYHLDYDMLTTEQESETRKLINYIELDWQDACLSPHKNKRNVKTASQQQVKEKIYRGSSGAWRKFEPYLNGIFDEFETS